MFTKKVPYEDLYQMVGSFVGCGKLDQEKAEAFVRDIATEEIRDFEHRSTFAYSLTEICYSALKAEKYELAAKAYQKAYELAPTMPEVEWLTEAIGLKYPSQQDFEKILELMKTMNEKPDI